MDANDVERASEEEVRDDTSRDAAASDAQARGDYAAADGRGDSQDGATR